MVSHPSSMAKCMGQDRHALVREILKKLLSSDYISISLSNVIHMVALHPILANTGL